MNAQWNTPISDRFSSLCARVFCPAAAILESEKTLGTGLDQGRPETGNNPCGWPVTSALDIWYILADILRCLHNEVKNSQPWTLITRQLFTTHRFWYEFNIFLTSDYNKRWRDIYNAEHWILKLQSWFWFLKLNVRMLRAQFSRTSNHMLNVGV